MIKQKYIICFFLNLFTIYLMAQDNKEWVILHTNDTHSQMETYFSKKNGKLGGIVRRINYICEVRNQYPFVLLLDAGDFSQGTPYYNYYEGFMEIEVMNMMGYQAATLGNHEFDNGLKSLAKRVKKAQFPIVCANYTFHEKSLRKLIKPYTIIKKDSLTIGIFGLTVDLAPLTSPATYSKLTYHDPIAIAKQMVATLKNEYNCNIIICLSHLGYDSEKGLTTVNDQILAEQVSGIDFIFGGHTHTLLSEPHLINSTTLFQSGSKGTQIGKVVIKK